MIKLQEQPNKTIQDVIAKRKEHSRRVDSKLIMKAYNYAKSHHGEQLRKSGEPYIIHPLNVAYILADIGLDDSTIAAALLHDVVEDTDVTKNDITKEFSEEISEMVAGVTKLGNISFASVEEQQVEDYRKMFLAMGKDIRVILIKLADRLHNMRTLKYLKRDRQIAISKETMDLYAPLANRLGLYSLKWELEDLAFKYLYPDEYHEVVEGINKKREERLQFIEKIMSDIRLALKKNRIDAEVTGRAKHLYSIYRKMKRDNKTLDQIYDLFALRILVNSVKVTDDKLAWLRETLEWQKDMQDPQEFLETLKTELFEDEVYVFTPKGKIIVLPRGATPIDFAYSIHQEIGNKMTGCKINSKMMPIVTPLKNGDIVDIITSENSKGPSRDWLKFVKSSSAKNKIKSWFKKALKAENIEKGKELIERELKRIGFTHSDLFKNQYVEPMMKKYNYKNLDEMYLAVGFGANSAGKVIARLLQEYRKEHEEEEVEEKIKELAKAKQRKPKASSSGIIVKGIDNCLVKLSKCCNPLPGDEIVGYITKGRGVSVHRKDCPNIKSLISEENRMIDVEWYVENKENYQADIEIHSNDRSGLLLDILKEIGTTKATILGVKTKTTKERLAIIDITLEVHGLDELNKAIKAIRKVDSVYDVRRT